MLTDCWRARVTSAASVRRLASISPNRMPMGTETFAILVPSLTPFKFTAIVWALAMPVQLMVTSLPLALAVAGRPPQVAMAEATFTGTANVITTLC